MKNFFIKNYVCFAMLILVSFTFAGGMFMAQISRYSVQEKQEQLETTVNYIDDIVKNNLELFQNKDYDMFLDTYLDQQAAVSGCTVMLTDANGKVQAYSTPKNDDTFRGQMSGTISSWYKKFAKTARFLPPAMRAACFPKIILSRARPARMRPAISRHS